jgi:hypothetical protein
VYCLSKSCSIIFVLPLFVTKTSTSLSVFTRFVCVCVKPSISRRRCTQDHRVITAVSQVTKLPLCSKGHLFHLALSHVQLLGLASSLHPGARYSRPYHHIWLDYQMIKYPMTLRSCELQSGISKRFAATPGSNTGRDMNVVTCPC